MNFNSSFSASKIIELLLQSQKTGDFWKLRGENALWGSFNDQQGFQV